MSMIAYAGSVDYSSEYVPNIPSKHYKHWDDLENLKGSVGVASCTRIGTPIATKSGTYNRPGPILLENFNFNIQNGIEIKKVVVHYSHYKLSESSSQTAATFPAFSGPVISLVGTGLSVTGNAPPTSLTHFKAEFTGVTREQLLSTNFGVKIAYPANTSTNTGRIKLGNVYLEVIYDVPNILVNATTKNNEVIVGSEFDVTFNVESLSKVNFNPSVKIQAPEIVTGKMNFVKKKSGAGTVSISGDTIIWDSEFSGGNYKNSITLTFKALSPSTVNMSCTEVLTGNKYSLPLTLKDYTVELSTTLNTNNKPIVTGDTVNYSITMKTNNPTVETKTLWIYLPAGVTILESAFNGLNLNPRITTTAQNTVLGVTFKLNKSYTIPLKVTFNSSGFYTQDIKINSQSNPVSLSTPIIIQSNTYLQLGFSRLLIPTDYTEAMGDKIKYTVMTVCKHIISNAESAVLQDWKNNLRFGIYNSPDSFVSDEDEFIKRVKWASKMSTKSWSEFKIDFTYDATCPLYLVYSHDYLGNSLYENIKFDFTNPVLVETAYYGEVDVTKPYPVPVMALCRNTDYATISLDGFKDTAPVIVYDWNSGGVFNTEDVVLRGITFSCDYVVSSPVELQVTVSLPKNTKKGYRNITLNKGSGKVNLGGRFDLFGLTPHDLRGKANDLLVELVVNNNYDEESLVELKNVILTVDYLIPNYGPYGFSVDGERSEEYGIYFSEMEYNLGTKNEIEEYHVNGTDTSIVNRMNIKPKEIDIEFSIDDCDLEEAVLLVEDVINKLFTNKRDILTNKPETKSIIFDHMPNKRFYFIRKDETDDDIVNGLYTCKVTLYIPKGTSEEINLTVTGSNGSTNGLISVEPVIHVQSLKKGSLQISETQTGAKLLVVDDRIDVGDVLTINNENRTVHLKKKGTTANINLSTLVDFSTTWFKIRGEYSFESTTAIITDVQYHNRR